MISESYSPLCNLPNELLMRTLTLDDNDVFYSPSQTQKKIQDIIWVSYSCKDLYNKVHSYAFFKLFAPSMHAFFLPPVYDSAFCWKAWMKERFSALNRWRSAPPQVIHRTFCTGVKQYAFCDQGELAIYGQYRDNFLGKATHLYRLTENGEFEQITLQKKLTPPFQECSPAYACSEKFIALLSDYNAIYIYSRTDQALLKPIIFEEGAVYQIEIKNEELFIRVKKNTDTQELFIFDLIQYQLKNESVKSLPIPFCVEKFYLLDNCILFIQQEKEDQNQKSVIAFCLQTLTWRSDGDAILTASFPSQAKIQTISAGDQALFSIFKVGRTIQINSIRIDHEKFHLFQWSFSLEKAHTDASILLSQYHLEKIFIYLSDHNCIVYDLSTGKWPGSMQTIFLLPDDLSQEWQPITQPSMYFPQMVTASFKILKIHCLFLSVKTIDQETLHLPHENFVTRIFTLDYTEKEEDNKKSENENHIEVDQGPLEINDFDVEMLIIEEEEEGNEDGDVVIREETGEVREETGEEIFDEEAVVQATQGMIEESDDSKA